MMAPPPFNASVREIIFACLSEWGCNDHYITGSLYLHTQSCIYVLALIAHIVIGRDRAKSPKQTRPAAAHGVIIVILLLLHCANGRRCDQITERIVMYLSVFHTRSSLVNCQPSGAVVNYGIEPSGLITFLGVRALNNLSVYLYVLMKFYILCYSVFCITKIKAKLTLWKILIP